MATLFRNAPVLYVLLLRSLEDLANRYRFAKLLNESRYRIDERLANRDRFEQLLSIRYRCDKQFGGSVPVFGQNCLLGSYKFYNLSTHFSHLFAICSILICFASSLIFPSVFSNISSENDNLKIAHFSFTEKFLSFSRFFRGTISSQFPTCLGLCSRTTLRCNPPAKAVGPGDIPSNPSTHFLLI